VFRFAPRCCISATTESARFGYIRAVPFRNGFPPVFGPALVRGLFSRVCCSIGNEHRNCRRRPRYDRVRPVADIEAGGTRRTQPNFCWSEEIRPLTVLLSMVRCPPKDGGHFFHEACHFVLDLPHPVTRFGLESSAAKELITPDPLRYEIATRLQGQLDGLMRCTIAVTRGGALEGERVVSFAENRIDAE
jgi:hypothetical protein